MSDGERGTGTGEITRKPASKCSLLLSATSNPALYILLTNSGCVIPPDLSRSKCCSSFSHLHATFDRVPGTQVWINWAVRENGVNQRSVPCCAVLYRNVVCCAAVAIAADTTLSLLRVCSNLPNTCSTRARNDTNTSNSAQHNTAQHSTAQHSTQRRDWQRNGTAQKPCHRRSGCKHEAKACCVDDKCPSSFHLKQKQASFPSLHTWLGEGPANKTDTELGQPLQCTATKKLHGPRFHHSKVVRV
jgi:hypothetical protein